MDDKDCDIDLSFPELGNPGIGGTEYLMVSTPYYLKKYKANDILPIIYYTNVNTRLPINIETVHVDNRIEAVDHAIKNFVDLLVYRPYRDTEKEFLNKKCDIIVPFLYCEDFNKPNIVKILATIENKILYMSRVDIPYFFRNNEPLKKHLSIIAFTYNSILKFCSYPPSKYEIIEGIELLRAVENRMDIQTMELEGETKAVDTYEDLIYVRKEMPYDPWLKIYKDAKK